MKGSLYKMENDEDQALFKGSFVSLFWPPLMLRLSWSIDHQPAYPPYSSSIVLHFVGTSSAVEEASEKFKKLMSQTFQQSLTDTDPLHVRWMSTEKLRDPNFKNVEEKARCTIYLLESSRKHCSSIAEVKLLILSNLVANLNTAEKILTSVLNDAIQSHRVPEFYSRWLRGKVCM